MPCQTRNNLITPQGPGGGANQQNGAVLALWASRSGWCCRRT